LKPVFRSIRVRARVEIRVAPFICGQRAGQGQGQGQRAMGQGSGSVMGQGQGQRASPHLEQVVFRSHHVLGLHPTRSDPQVDPFENTS
jgi:hypothetical protein